MPRSRWSRYVRRPGGGLLQHQHPGRVSRARADRHENADRCRARQLRLSCIDGYDPDALPVDPAREAIRRSSRPSPRTSACTARVLGRVLGRDIVSRCTSPRTTTRRWTAMRCAGPISRRGETTLRRSARRSRAARSQARSWPGECVRIMTGAVMPAGTDTVVTQERAAESQAACASSRAPWQGGPEPAPRRRGPARGDVVFARGPPLRPAELGLMASLGIGEVPSIAGCASPSSPPATSCARSARRSTQASLRQQPLHALGDADAAGLRAHRPGRRARRAGRNRGAFASAAASADVVITSGGVSVGEADYVKQSWPSSATCCSGRSR